MRILNADEIREIRDEILENGLDKYGYGYYIHIFEEIADFDLAEFLESIFYIIKKYPKVETDTYEFYDLVIENLLKTDDLLELTPRILKYINGFEYLYYDYKEDNLYINEER